MKPYFQFCWTPKDWALPLQIGFSTWKNYENNRYYQGHVHILFLFWRFRNWDWKNDL